MADRSEWHDAELICLRERWPQLELDQQGHWVRLKNFRIPEGWDREFVNLAVKIPDLLPGQAPYGFWIEGGLTLLDGRVPSNYAFPSDPLPFSVNIAWGKFSWGLDESNPISLDLKGKVMILFIQSVAQRLGELN